MSIGEISSRLNEKVSNSREFIDNRSSVFISPKSARGLSGWEFDVLQDESLSIEADITDHYVESGTYLNDHKVIKPVQITVSGLKGELVYKPPEGLQGQTQELNNKLTEVDAYLGDYTPGMIQEIQRSILIANSAVSRINQNLDRTQNVLSSLSGEGPETTKQQRAYTELKALFNSSQLITVQTPWRYFDSMMITSISCRQGPDSAYYSQISVTLKEIRFANIEINTFDENILPPREEMQISEEQDTGRVQGRENSLLFDAAVGLGAIQ